MLESHVTGWIYCGGRGARYFLGDFICKNENHINDYKKVTTYTLPDSFIYLFPVLHNVLVLCYNMTGIHNEHDVNHEATMLFLSQVCASSTLLLETVKNLM
jgi:hypothetical protein